MEISYVFPRFRQDLVDEFVDKKEWASVVLWVKGQC